MLYWLAEYLQHYIGGFRLFTYQTLRAILGVLTALVFCFVFGPGIIRRLQVLKFGQVIRRDGPQSHLAKTGTPTMGGSMILGAIAIATLLWGDLGNRFIWFALFVTLSFGAVGFADDWLKIRHKSPKGLVAKKKYFWLSLTGLATSVGIYVTAKTPVETILILPLLKEAGLQLGWAFIPWAYLVIVGSSNAVNLTDGLDGLAIMPTVLVASALAIFAYATGNKVFATYLGIPYIAGVGELTIFCTAIAGAGLGFLWFNAPPAAIFMGDTGSLSLGGLIGSVAVATKHEIVMAIIGGVFVMETLSVIIQVASFKMTGKRVFLMAPIHHHFEKKGWTESQVVIRFWIIAVILALVGLATLKLR